MCKSAGRSRASSSGHPRTSTALVPPRGRAIRAGDASKMSRCTSTPRNTASSTSCPRKPPSSTPTPPPPPPPTQLATSAHPASSDLETAHPFSPRPIPPRFGHFGHAAQPSAAASEVPIATVRHRPPPYPPAALALLIGFTLGSRPPGSACC
eukprot:CAMPEP_0181172176 /NCGR_PEP_ID=MMETSP1096-20121128/2311_1 /TAXON_ID=156174 ORGANISM="Chrysochromulina ericina, Strain CCMP281" /NCGR_SAMPLE_ID=MMETSP1096 /ASSEMBLY_ACC=CAM_ASM_000453 /LENGTH=151 /DNA_ID=CAMNT_0023259889 /DNA_START=243 /DNA_END=698 /DNA_ORIENTATION=-